MIIVIISSQYFFRQPQGGEIVDNIIPFGAA
jgi:hypothetical protein